MLVGSGFLSVPGGHVYPPQLGKSLQHDDERGVVPLILSPLKVVPGSTHSLLSQ